MRILNIFFYGLLLVLLIFSTCMYFYGQNDSFHSRVESIIPASRLLAPLLKFAGQHDVGAKGVGLAGVALVSLLVICYFMPFIKQIIKRGLGTNFAAFFFGIVVVLGGGILAGVYYYPHDTISFGTVFTLRRGPRDKFLELMIHIGFLVVVVHLFFFLLLNFGRIVFWKKKVSRVKKKTLTSKEKSNSGDHDAAED